MDGDDVVALFFLVLMVSIVIFVFATLVQVVLVLAAIGVLILLPGFIYGFVKEVKRKADESNANP